jgi:hypothetical protein
MVDAAEVLARANGEEKDEPCGRKLAQYFRRRVSGKIGPGHGEEFIKY